MKNVYSDRIINRLQQLVVEIENACDTIVDYYGRLREFKRFCDATPVLAGCLAELPQVSHDFTVSWQRMENRLSDGVEGYGMRWDAISQIVENGSHSLNRAWKQVGGGRRPEGLSRVTKLFVIPIYHFLVDQLESSSSMLYVLLRYKRWAEWFESERLRKAYGEAKRQGEAVLDKDVRRFLFESGIDYPYSEPRSPGGRVDVVAGLETDDPLVLEIKVWDSEKGYRENRIRDGLRQVMDYAAKYGKDRGHVVVFNLDQQPLSFISQTSKGEWPPCIEHGGRTYCFVDIHIPERLEPISQQDKGKRVQIIEIDLAGLLEDCLGT